MSKYFVVRIQFLSQDSKKVKIGDYISSANYSSASLKQFSGDKDTLDVIVPQVLKDYYLTSNFKSDLASPINDLSDEKQISVTIAFDYDKLTSNSSDFSIFSDLLKNKFLSPVDTAHTEVKNIPARPNYELVKDEKDNAVNTFIATQNGGGWSIIYRLKSITQSENTQPTSPTASVSPTSATQSSPVVQNTPPQKGPTDTGVEQNESRNEKNGPEQNQQQSSSNKDSNSIVPTSLTKRFGPNKNLLQIKPIKFNLAGLPEQSKKEFADGLGYVPFIWYNSYQIEPNNIKFFSLYNDGILPKMKVIFVDPVNLMQDTGFPLDDSKIQVFINSRNKNIKSVFMQFKITNFSLGDNNKYSIEGIADVRKLYIRQFKAYQNKTSDQALQDLCRESGLGYYNNVDNTDDKMTWINPGNVNIDFLEEVLMTSYKSDESYMTGYVDYYYSFNYVDIEKELNRNVDDQLGVHVNGLEDILKLPNKDKVAKLYLTNDQSMRSSPNYFDEYKVLNNSTQISLTKGYLNKVKFYDILKKEFLIFDIDSITSQGDKTIILKSSPQDEEFFKENVSTTFTGRIDTDNMHKNFNYSYVQNSQNIDDLRKIGMEIVMPNPNFNFYRYQKVKLLLSNQTSTPSQSVVIGRLSGDWLIIDIRFLFKDGKLKQYMTLIRRELSLSDEELKQEPGLKNNKEKSETPTTNPTEQTTNPTAAEIAQATGSTSSNSNASAATASNTNQNPDLEYVNDKMRDNKNVLRTLVVVDKQPIEEQVAIAYLKMKEAAAKDGIKLNVNSGFRPAFGPVFKGSTSKGNYITITTQESLRRDKSRWIPEQRAKFKDDDDYVFNASGSAYSPATAPPGKSNHGNAFALDLSTGSRVAFNKKLNDQIYTWLVNNSYKYGFVRGVGSEEWHFEYRPEVSKQGPYAVIKPTGPNDNLFYPDLGLDNIKTA